jgi:glutathione S-transferase
MKLYDFPKAPNPRRLRIFLAEKGIEIPTELIDLNTGEQMGEAFTRKNPLGTVPVLELDTGQRIVDSLVICRYLEELNPEPPLLGRNALERAQVNWWLRRIDHEGLFSVGECLRNKSPHFADRVFPGPNKVAQIEALVTRGYQRTLDFFAMLDQRLQGRDFITSGHYTLADISAQVVVDFARWIKAEPEDDQTALKSWHQKMAARPSAAA